jgi:hypothetical protein
LLFQLLWHVPFFIIYFLQLLHCWPLFRPNEYKLNIEYFLGAHFLGSPGTTPTCLTPASRSMHSTKSKFYQSSFRLLTQNVKLFKKIRNPCLNQARHYFAPYLHGHLLPTCG